MLFFSFLIFPFDKAPKHLRPHLFWRIHYFPKFFSVVFRHRFLDLHFHLFFLHTVLIPQNICFFVFPRSSFLSMFGRKFFLFVDHPLQLFIPPPSTTSPFLPLDTFSATF